MGRDMQLTPRAKRVIDLAYAEARRLGNDYIGTEHLLLGLVREGDGLAGRVLSRLGVDLAQARLAVATLQGASSDHPPAGSDRRSMLSGQAAVRYLLWNYFSDGRGLSAGPLPGG